MIAPAAVLPSTTHAILAAGGGAAVAGLAVSLFVLREAWRDLGAVLGAGITNGRRIVARRAVEAGIFRSVALALFAFAAFGTFAVTPADADPTPLRVAALSAFALAQVILAVDAARSLRSRRELLGQPGRRR